MEMPEAVLPPPARVRPPPPFPPPFPPPPFPPLPPIDTPISRCSMRLVSEPVVCGCAAMVTSGGSAAGVGGGQVAGRGKDLVM